MVQTQRAMSAPVAASPRADDKPKPKRDGVPDLYYYPDTASWRTPIRDEGIELIYQAAKEADDGRLKYGYVSLYTRGTEVDSETLDITLVVDTNDWDAIAAWDYAVTVKLIEWEKGLSDEQRKEFGVVLFMYLPAIYTNASA